MEIRPKPARAEKKEVSPLTQVRTGYACHGRADLRSLEEYQIWKATIGDSADWVHFLRGEILRDGFDDPFYGWVAPTDVEDGPGDLREGLAANGMTSRARAVLATLAHMATRESRIYAAEATTPLALRLRGQFPWFLGSEYADDPVRRANMFPIPFQDLMGLTFEDETFDLVITNDVLEHVPDLDQALREMARVLKPGGYHIGTHPFMYEREVGDLRAQFVDGKLVNYMEPEYHVNPFEDGGALVFETPGWDILRRAHAAGFSDAAMRLVWSTRHGYIANQLGIFVLSLQK